MTVDGESGAPGAEGAGETGDSGGTPAGDDKTLIAGDEAKDLGDKSLIAEEKAPEKKAEGEEKPAEEKAEGEADDKKAEGEEKKEEKPEGAPEKYELKMPEGFAVNDESLGEFTAAFKEADLTNDQAQALVDAQEKHINRVAEGHAAQLQEQRDGWRDSIKGRDDFPEAMSNVRRLSKEFGNEEFQKLVTETWVGDHPAFFDFMSQVGAKLGEDGLVEGSAGRGSPKTASQVLYPKS